MFSERIDRLTGSLVRELLSWTQRPEVISFAGGLPAADAMPAFDLDDVPEHLKQYGPSEGERDLREAIAAHARVMGIRCTADQVLVVTGSQQGIDLMAKLFIDPGTPLAMEAPGYLAAIQVFKLFGARFIDLPVGPEGVDPAAFAQVLHNDKPALAYLNPTFQNPSGACYSPAVRSAVAAALTATGVPLLEDDPYRELAFESIERRPICADLSEDAPWVFMGSFSKTGIPGWRIGYLIASPMLYPHLVRLKQCTDLHSNRIGQWWCARFLNSPDFFTHLDRLAEVYRARRDAMADSLERHMADLATWSLPRGGLFFWIKLNEAVDDQALLRATLERNVAFMPGSPFFANPQHGASWMRLNFSHATPEKADEGIARLAETLRVWHVRRPAVRTG